MPYKVLQSIALSYFITIPALYLLRLLNCVEDPTVMQIWLHIQ